MAPQISSSPQRKEDAFTGVLQATDDYIESLEEISSALKAGWFSLARAKYAAVPSSSISQAAYSGDMQASAVVHLREPADPEDIYDRFELQQLPLPARNSSKGTAQDATKASNASSSANRPEDQRPGSSDNGSSEAQASAAEGAGDCGGGGGSGGGAASAGAGARDPLSWFGGGLPSGDLRQAQREFKQVLVAAVAAANRVQQLRALADGLLADESEAGGGDDELADQDGGAAVGGAAL